MVNRNIWPLLGLVCAFHFFLLQVFLNADSGVPSVGENHARLSLALVNATQPPTALLDKAVPQKPQPPPQPAELKAPPKPSVQQAQELAVPPLQPVQSNGVSPAFDRSNFLDFEAVDQPATSTSEFEPTLTKVLPAGFEPIVLELLIDETGRTVHVACIEGDCSAAPDDGLQQLLLVPFLPAIKNGQPVDSRKVIQVLPTPTFGL